MRKSDHQRTAPNSGRAEANRGRQATASSRRNNGPPRATSALAALVERAGEVTDDLPWSNETLRWLELVFTLLTQTTELPHARVRAGVWHIAESGLLDPRTLCNANRREALRSALLRQGFAPREAKHGTEVVTELMDQVRTRFGGHVQRYLRLYGELMLKQLRRYFPLKSLPSARVEDAFTLWFQNAVNLPLALTDPTMRQFCKRTGITPPALIDAADESDLNVAMLDDLLFTWASLPMRSTRREKKSSRRATQHVAQHVTRSNRE